MSDDEKQPLPAFFMGTADWIRDKFAYFPLPIRCVDWFFRGCGSALFLDNPLSGALLIAAVTLNNPWAGLYATGSGLLALLLALVISEEARSEAKCGLRSGGVFNAFLIGAVLSQWLTTQASSLFWIAQVVLAILAVYVNKSLTDIMKRLSLPALNSAFILLTLLIFAAENKGNIFLIHVGLPEKKNSTILESSDVYLDVENIFTGIVKSVGNTVAVSNLISCGLMILAILIYSPLMTLQALVGAMISMMTALSLGAPLTNVFEGMWSYNAVLSSMALGGFFYVWSFHAQMVTFLSAILSTFVYGLCLRFGTTLSLPVLALPFVITVSLLLLVGDGILGLQRAENLSYPEKHLAISMSPNSDECSSLTSDSDVEKATYRTIRK